MDKPSKQEDVQQQPLLTQSEEGTLTDLFPAQDQGFDKPLELWVKKILHGPILGNELGWLGSYKVLKILGRGGMGVVFQAEDSQLQRLVALKVMLPDLANQDKARERFLREARAVAALRNDHVVTIYQVGQEGDTPYLAMEFLYGRSLEDCLNTGLKFKPREIVRIGRKVAQGLAAAHASGLIHRDIKPANIWLESSATDHGLETSDYRVKILDFGLTRPVQQVSSLTKTGNIVGTPHYMSPEQARARTVDARSDLFSLGTVLYRLCANQQPFQGDTLMALLTSLAVDVPRPIRDLNPEVPQDLADLITRMLAKDPAQRPASACEVVKVLSRLEGQWSPGPDSAMLSPTPDVPTTTTTTTSTTTSTVIRVERKG